MSDQTEQPSEITMDFISEQAQIYWANTIGPEEKEAEKWLSREKFRSSIQRTLGKMILSHLQGKFETAARNYQPVAGATFNVAMMASVAWENSSKLKQMMTALTVNICFTRILIEAGHSIDNGILTIEVDLSNGGAAQDDFGGDDDDFGDIEED